MLKHKWLDWDLFLEYMQELEDFYGKKLSVFAKDAYYERLRNLTEDQIRISVCSALCDCEFMPTANRLKELAGFDRDRNPGENWSSIVPDYLALPSAEMNADGLSDEQRTANLNRLVAALVDAKDMKKPKMQPIGKAKFPSMRAMLQSGVSAFVREALLWAKGQPNVWLIYPDGSDVACDMEWIEDQDVEF